MNFGDFSFIAAFLRERSGLIVTPDKTYLIESRLNPIAREHGLANVDQVIAKVREDPASPLARSVVYAMTTNETSFFRDSHPFETLRKTILPKLMERRTIRKVIRIWSAACATGQEPYSLAMMLKESFGLSDWYINIIATDLTPAVLERAKEGYYSGFEVQRGMPIQYLIKYFDQDGDRWRIKQEIRSMIEFRQLDLLRDFSALGTFDVILCRNVLIYFDQPTKSTVLGTLRRQLAADGVLMLGGSESVFGLCDQYTDIPGLRGVYCQKQDQTWQPNTGGAQKKPAMVPPLRVVAS